MESKTRRVAVLGGNRIPFARSNTVYATASNQEMLTAAIDGLVTRFGLEGERVGEVVAGAVLKHSRDFNLARESVLGSKLSAETPATDIQQACGTGLQAAIQVANKIALGQIDVGIAGGTDTTSDAPIAVGENLRKILLELNRAKDLKGRLAALAKVRPGDIVPSIPQNGEPRTGLSMGDHAALTALEWQIGREEQDELAAASHQHLAAAYDARVPRRPGHAVPRPRARPEPAPRLLGREARQAQAGLRQGRGGHDDRRQLHAADRRRLGGAARLGGVGRGARPAESLAYLTAYETAAVDYVHGGEGLLMAPAYAVARMLEREGLTLQDFDFYEIHEAFASQVLATLKAWEDPVFCKERLGLDAPLGSIDRAKLNVNGSSLAAGHPFAATGGRIVNVLAKLLAQKAAEGPRPRPDLDLRRRRPGRRRDPGTLSPGALGGSPGVGTTRCVDDTDVLFDGRYALDGILGAGGAGTVHRAWDRVLDRPVALKMLRSGASDDTVHRARLRAEAQLAGSLQHPGIAQIYDYGEAHPAGGDGPPTPYIAMQFVEGEPLSCRAEGAPAAARRRGHGDRRPGRRGAAGGPRGRDRAPRPQARQHPDHPRRPARAGRLRHRPVGHPRAAHADRHDRGQRRLHQPRADARGAPRRRGRTCTRSAWWPTRRSAGSGRSTVSRRSPPRSRTSTTTCRRSRTTYPRRSRRWSWR